MALSLLERGLLRLREQGSPGSDSGWLGLRAALEHYLAELELWNPRLGLVEARGEALVGRHILDCLAAFPCLLQVLNRFPLPAHTAMADIGSGAGLPGIPLLLAIKHLVPERAIGFSMTLVEKQQRRIGFLLNAKALLKLDNLILRQEKLEDLVADGSRFGLVSARAFSPLEPSVLAALRGILDPAGLLFLYKGRLEKIDQELCGSGLIRSESKEFIVPSGNTALVLPISVPYLDEERHIVLIPPGAGAC